MNGRENILRAIRRQNPEHVPFGLSLCPSLDILFREKTGQDDYFEYFGIPYRYISLLPSKYPNNYSKYYDNLPTSAWIDEWGVGHLPGSVAHFTQMLHPMENFNTPEEVYSFPLPDLLSDYRWEGFSQRVEETKNKGLLAVYSAIQIFEPAWYLRGLDILLMDMLDNEEMAYACLDRMTNLACKLAQRLASYGIDMIVYGDDVGTQRSMMLSHPLWTYWLKPTMRKAIKAAKDVNPKLIAYYHSDGMIYDIIPDLIEIGVDVLNPIQPECMDPVRVKEMYGDKLAFWGTIGTQTTMPFGTCNDVEQKVKEMIETVGKGGGLVLAPTHLLEPEVPWENIICFVDSVKKFGLY